MNTQQARERGYEILKGSFRSTQDDRIGRWYICQTDEPLRKWGAGYRTRQDALDDLERFFNWMDE